MQYRLEALLHWLDDLYGGRSVTGSFWLRVDRSATQRQFDFCFVAEPPSSIGDSDESADRLIQFCETLRQEERIRPEATIVAETGLNVTARLFDSTPVERFRWGNWWNPLHDVSGDLWRYWTFGNSDVFLVCDGLGHGVRASEASRIAAQTIERCGDRPVLEMVEMLHENLRSTRGVVLFLGRLPVEQNRLEYCTIGNIAAKAVGPDQEKRLWSYNGTVGYNLPDLNTQYLPLEDYEQLVFHTDGVQAPERDFYDAQFFRNGPLMNAARIYSTHARSEDDSLVSVLDL